MTILSRRRFRRSHYFWQSGELWFGNSILSDLFDLPSDVRQIWVTLRDRETASSMRLRLELLPPLCRRVSITTENHVTSSQTYGVGYCLARLRVRGIKVVYVEVEYHEKEQGDGYH